MEAIRVIEKNKRFILQLVQDEAGSEYLLKLLAEDFPSLDSQAQLQNEWKVASKLNHPGLRRVLGESFYENRKCLQLEYIEGENLQNRAPMDMGSFFRFALQVTDTLLYIHHAGIIHRDISIYNILFNALTNQYVLIDLGTAISAKEKYLPDYLIGTAAYSSPELTGRLQRYPDHRADIYSLGVVFYEMLTGVNPFRDISEMQTIYKQLAWLPEDLHKVNPSIPITVSRIIMKMLAKDPDYRYFNTKSLSYDLEEARLLFRRNVVPGDFEPGSSEKPPPYNDTPPLVGYESERVQLKQKFKAMLNGESQLTWLTGPAGIGKSTLIRSFLPDFYDQQVLYLNIGTGSGHASAFALLFELFETLLQRIDEEGEEQILKRKIRFSSENISDVSILVDRIPGLSRFVNAKNVEKEFGSIESQNLFQLALQDLLRVLAMPERPIIAHFSQSEHIDQESAKFFQRFIKDVPEEFVWIIFEQSGEQTLEEDHQIRLKGLDSNEMSGLFREMVKGEITSNDRVPEYIHSFANNNPGKLVHLVRYWYNEGFFEFDAKRNYWFWKNPENRALFPEAIDTALQIHDRIERELIEWASFLEGHFTLELLDQLSEYDRASLKNALQALNIKNLIQSSRDKNGNEYYKLTSRIDPNKLITDTGEWIRRHNRIAGFLEESENDPYRLAHHINKSIAYGDRSFIGKKALIHNLQAGLKAKNEGAFHLARKYFTQAADQLEDSTDISKDTIYQLHLNHAELASLEGSHEEAALIFERALKHASTQMEIAEVYSSQVILFNHQGNHEASLESGMKALETLGFPIPAKGNKWLLIRKLVSTWLKLHRKDPMELIKLPAIEDEKVILSLKIIENLHTAIFNKDSELLLIVLLISMERILKYGNAPEGYSAYAGFGAVLALGFGNYKKGWAFTIAGLEMTKRFNNKFYIGRSLFSKGAWLINYITHTRESFPVLEEGIQLSKESGDFSYANNGYMNLLEAHFMAATPLDLAEKNLDEIIAFSYQVGYDDILALSLSGKLYVLRLTNREAEFQGILEKWFKGRELEPYTQESAFKHIRIYHLLLNAYWQYFNGEIDKGLEDIAKCNPYLHTLQGPAIIVDYYVIRGLLNFESYHKNKDRKALSLFKSSTKKVKKYAKLVKGNFGHRYLLLHALDTYRKGNFFAARKKMREAMVLARENDFHQIESICALYLAKWFMEIGQKDYARLHFRDAMNVYSKWQTPFLAELASAQFDTFTTAIGRSGSHNSSSSFRSGHSGYSNPEVLMQSALSVAAETDFESLLDVMNQIFVEQAGATRSLLFIRSGNDLRLLYEMEGQKRAFHPFPGKPMNQIKNLPLSIIHLSQRSHETVIINDTAQEQRFKFEPYLRNKAPFTMMVTPLLYRGELSGLIYFENNLITHAFSEHRQELLKLLSGQFAVALQNARLVEELEHRVKERTLALESEKDRADHLLKNILPVETAEELKIKGKATSKYHEQVTVMFTDFIGFTKTSEKMHPDALVKMLDYYFRSFDRITKKYGLEKIKTIGDAYLCVSGLPLYQPKHALLALQAAFEIMDFVTSDASKEEYGLEVRIGLHSGPVVAGVVGEEKFAFDIWGDTVNTASRMESNSQAGKVNITKETMDLVLDSGKYTFTYRGKIKAKNKGEIDMFFVKENQNTMLDHEGAKAMILDKMRRELSEDLHYHSIEHTMEIIANVENIGTKEGLNEEEMILLSTAAAFHDSGFMFSPEDHEDRSAKIAANYLPEYGFSEEQIQAIQNMIRATKIPQQPRDLPSKVLCDADLFYLGTDDFEHTGKKLYEEFKIQGVVQNRKDWIELQIRFLESHHYHTQTAIKSCEELKKSHLANLRTELDQL